MSKRTAINDLNHENWDQDDEPEECGTFSKASDDIIKTRVIKVAKRRNPIRSDDSSGKPSAFQGFSGFTKTTPATTTTSTAATFGFLANLSNNKTETTSTTTAKINGLEDKNDESVVDNNSKLNEYYAKLKGLNESVSSWIQKHVNLNPFINLQPIFKDYENYFNEIEELNKNLVEETTKTGVVVTEEKKTTPLSLFKFGIPNQTTTTVTATTTTVSKPTFSFGSNSSGTNLAFGVNTNTTKLPSFNSNLSSSSTLTFNPSPTSNPSFSFSANSSSTPPSFTFKATTTLSSNLTTTTTTTTTNSSKDNESGTTTTTTTNVDDEDQPPKVEFTPVIEEDSIYTKRCKVFVKKDKTFTDRGVGNLYLKSIKDNEKYQLIVRADTNLGNLLCNFILSKSIPLQRMGKKDVMLICLPTPDTKPPPLPILLRVKSSEEADNLLETLKKYMK